MNTNENDENERYTRYMGYQRGAFFASNTEMEAWAEKQPFLKKLSTIIPWVGEKYQFGGGIVTNWYYQYIPVDWEVEDLLKAFTTGTLNSWGIYQFNPEYQI